MSNAVRVAAPQQRKVRPAFMVQQLTGEKVVTLHSFNEKGKRIAIEKKEPAGYLVKFSKGHSIRVRNDADMARLGFDQTIDLVDGDDVVGQIPNTLFDTKKHEEIEE